MSDHGTRHRYMQGCRCNPCSTVQSDYQARRNAGIRVDDEAFGDLLAEWFPEGLTDECPARRKAAA